MKRYKIHAIETVENEQASSNGQFYETKEEALMQCKLYMRQPQNQRQSFAGFVVFEAVATVEPRTPPLFVTDLRTGEVS